VPFDDVKDEWLINASSRQRLLLVINLKTVVLLQQ